VLCTDLTAGAVSHYWTFGNGQTSTAAASTATYTQTGTYLVRLISAIADGCSNIAEKNIVVLQTSSASNLPGNKANSVALYPNPAGEEVLLAFAENQAGAVDIRVMDLLGRTTRTIQNAGVAADKALRVDVATLPTGMYTVLISLEGRPYWSGKFLKN